MGLMLSADRTLVRRDFSGDLSSRNEQLGALTKAELLAAVDAIDVWLDANEVALNQAIPQPARAELTRPQKARLLQFVVQRRYITGA